MTPQEPVDLHADFVRDLFEAGDWPALLRYWMAHQYEPALQHAVSWVQLRGADHPGGAALVEYVTAFAQAPYDPSLKLTGKLVDSCQPVEQVTLYLCYLIPRLALCDRADGFLVAQQQQLFQIGLQAIKEAKRLADVLQDNVLLACFAFVEAGAKWKSQELEDAKCSYQGAEQIYRRLEQARPGAYLADVALTLAGVGAVHFALHELGDAKRTFQEAENIFRCLERACPGSYLVDVAGALNNLGNVHFALQELEDAKRSYQEALTIRRRLEQSRPGVYLADVATTLNNLGNVQRNLRELEDAKLSCQEALTIRRRLEQARPGVYPAKIAMTLSNLGIVQSDLQELEDAKHSFQEAESIFHCLEQVRPGVYLADVAMTLNNLGNMQRDLQELEDAKHSYQKTESIFRRLEQARPGVYLANIALTLNNLGNVQHDLQDWNDAQCTYQEAESIYRHLEQANPGVYLANLAMTLSNLGLVQTELLELREAKCSCQEALTMRRHLEQARPGVYLADVATTLNNLGSVQRALQELKDAKHSFQEAEKHLRHLEQAHAGVYLAEIAMVLGNLGAVQSDLQELEGAKHSFQGAESIYRLIAKRFPTAHLPVRLTLCNNLGLLYLTDNDSHARSNRRAAQGAFRAARDCAVQIRGLFRDSELRNRSQTQHVGVYDALVGVCVDLWEIEGNFADLREAVEVAEQGRSRHLLEMLADETLSPASTPLEMATQFRDLRKQLRQAQMRLQLEESRPPTSPPPKPPTDGDGGKGTKMAELLLSADQIARDEERIAFVRRQVDRLTAQHQQLLADIQKHDAEFNPDDPVASIDLPTIHALLPTDKRTAAIQFTLTDKHGIAILITRDELRAVKLPELDLRQANGLLREWLTAYYDKKSDWSAAIADLLAKVASRTVHPLEQALQELQIERLLIAPHRALHLFPLHACKQSSGRPLLDDYEVVYTPSLSILHRCASRQRTHREQLLLVENPTGDLPFTEVEGSQLRELYRWPEPIHHYAFEAGKDRLLREAGAAHVLNYTGHAYFDLMNPLESGFLLESKTDRNKWLTLRDIFCGLHLPNNRLTVINGCESGLTRGDDLADELIGLPTGFLYAGSTAVLSTLWRVYDISSALLVSEFHRRWLSGQEIGAALRSAQMWLRDGIPGGVYLRDTLLPPLLKTLDDPSVSKKCREQAEHYAKTSPNSPPFAGEVHWAAFFASGLTYPMEKQQ